MKFQKARGGKYNACLYEGEHGTIHSCKQCSTMAEEASPPLGIIDKYHVEETRNNPVFCSAEMTLLQYCSSL